jgi:SAM-dependent methyltransferase
MPQAEQSHAEQYDQTFYDRQMDGSFASAKRYRDLLLAVLKPTSVLDIGCGRGGWLKAFGEAGAEHLVGIDGPWNSQTKMLDARIEFRSVNLEQLQPLNEKFDLSMSLEVGEHLTPAASDGLVNALCSASDVVMFGAARTGQGGVNHINEQPASYWASKFKANGYFPVDYFRPKAWGVAEIQRWYRQNTFLYCRRGSALGEQLVSQEVVSFEFLDIEHLVGIGPRGHFKVFLRSLKNKLS